MRPSDRLNAHREAIRALVAAYRAANPRVFGQPLRKANERLFRNIEVIGEASRDIGQVDPAFIAKHPEIECADAGAMRNAFAHGCDKIDFEVVRRTVERTLARMHGQVIGALQEISGKETS